MASRGVAADYRGLGGIEQRRAAEEHLRHGIGRDMDPQAAPGGRGRHEHAEEEHPEPGDDGGDPRKGARQERPGKRRKRRRDERGRQHHAGEQDGRLEQRPYVAVQHLAARAEQQHPDGRQSHRRERARYARRHQLERRHGRGRLDLRNTEPLRLGGQVGEGRRVGDGRHQREHLGRQGKRCRVVPVSKERPGFTVIVIDSNASPSETIHRARCRAARRMGACQRKEPHRAPPSFRHAYSGEPSARQTPAPAASSTASGSPR